MEEGEDGEKLQEELSACDHFFVDTETANGRHKVFNFQMPKLDTKIINEKLKELFNKLDSAAKINISLGFVLRNIETGEYRYFYAHENNVSIEKNHLLCTKADLITIRAKLETFDFVEQCTQEREITKWRFKLITNVTIFAVLLKNNPMGTNSVLPDPLLKNHSVNLLFSNKEKYPYKDNLCLFHAMARYMNGHNDLDSHTSRYFTEFISNSGKDPENFRGVSVEDLPVVEEIVQMNISIYDFDIQEGEYVGELTRRSIGRFNKTVKLLRFNNHIIHTNDFHSFFKCPCCGTVFKRSEFLNNIF